MFSAGAEPGTSYAFEPSRSIIDGSGNHCEGEVPK